MTFTPSINRPIHLHFQCSNNMTTEQICEDVNKYILDHQNELELDQTRFPIYFKRYILIRDDSLWEEK